MDPIMLILTTVATCATFIAKGTASEVVKDAYYCLKELIQSKFIDKEEAMRKLAEYERNPNVRESPLKDALIEAEIDRDQKIIEAAQKVMTLVNQHQIKGGTQQIYNFSEVGTIITAEQINGLVVNSSNK